MSKESTEKSDFITDDEREILDLLAEAHNKFVALADKHPTAMQGWTFYIHGLESLIEHRICKRVAKDFFRKQNNMKDFDLAAAKRGATVCTRDGSPVRILAFDCRKRRKGNVARPIVAEVFFKDDWEFKDGNWAISDYEESGRWHGIGTESEYDLMMADDDYLEKLERGEYGETDHIGEAAEKVKYPRSIEDEKSGNNRSFTSMLCEDMERYLALERLRKTVEDLKSGATSDKNKTTENWDYWRMKYAGDIMSRLFGSEKLSGLTFDIISREVRQMADALIEELKRTKK